MNIDANPHSKLTTPLFNETIVNICVLGSHHFSQKHSIYKHDSINEAFAPHTLVSNNIVSE